MNIIRAQREIFDAISKDKSVHAFKTEDDRLFVTADGFVGYIFSLDMICFNTDKISMIEKPLFPIRECVHEENELKITQEFHSEHCGIGRTGRMFRKLAAPGKTVYVNDASLRNFQAPMFFQEKEENLKQIVITEGKDNVPVGAVLPVRINTYSIRGGAANEQSNTVPARD